MNRFWIFPLVLGVALGILPVFVLFQGFLPMEVAAFPNYQFTFSPFNIVLRDVGEGWRMAAPYAATVGALIGVGMAFFDWLRNGYHQSSALGFRLLGNFWWCGLYVFAINALNTAIFWFVYKAIVVSSHTQLFSLWSLPLLLSAILNLSGVGWASIRTITSSDIVSPATLGRKLRRSSHIEG